MVDSLETFDLMQGDEVNTAGRRGSGERMGEDRPETWSPVMFVALFVWEESWKDGDR